MVFQEKYKRLMAVIKPVDTLGILITADPDAMALKRLFWRKPKGRTFISILSDVIWNPSSGHDFNILKF